MADKMDKNRLAAARIRIRYLKEDNALLEQYPSDVSLYWQNQNLEEILNLMEKSADSIKLKIAKQKVLLLSIKN